MSDPSAMINKILFEAGSTKTTVLSALPIIHNENAQINHPYFKIDLPGYNPNRSTSSFEASIKTLMINPNDEIYFYGSGLNADANKAIVRALFKQNFGVDITVFDDVTGAARAVLKTDRGIVGILGTGAVVAYYDGEKISALKGGWGYLIDDIGGGYELGKLIISAWLNEKLSTEFAIKIEKHFGIKRDDFIQVYYSRPNLGSSEDGLKLIAGLVPILLEFRTNYVENEIISDYFKLFYERHVRSLCEETGVRKIGFVGSIAKGFEAYIRNVLEENGIELDKVIQFPAANLWTYHFEK